MNFCEHIIKDKYKTFSLNRKKRFINFIEEEYGVKIFIIPYLSCKGMIIGNFIFVDKKTFKELSYNGLKFLTFHEVSHHINNDFIKRQIGNLLLPFMLIIIGLLIIIDFFLSAYMSILGKGDKIERKTDEQAFRLMDATSYQRKEIKAEMWDYLIRGKN